MSTHSHSSAYTPKAERLSPSSVTPTRHTQSAGATPDFTSPSAYINHDAFIHTEPNTPHGLTDTSYGLPSSSSTMSMGLSNPHAIEGEYGFAYGDFTVTGAYPVAGVEEQQFGQTTAEPEDERTPVVSDAQQPIPSSSLPTHPRLHDASIRAPRPQKPLMSPFRTFSPQSDLAAYQSIPYDPSQVPQCVDPSAAFHYPPTGPPQQSNIHPHHPQHISGYVPEFAPSHSAYHPNQQFAQMHPSMVEQMYLTGAPYYVPPGQQYEFAGPPRSRPTSPAFSITSSQVSLARSESTSSELRVQRPKVKLTFEDKRNIVELHRANSSLRQEDIARQYGVDRSTISKICLSAHRWTAPQEPQLPPPPKEMRTVGGRFPAIEAKLDEWLDHQLTHGGEARDSVLREKAKAIAREIGFPQERFKASAKWLDKFKDRRRATGKPVASPVQHMPYGYYPYAAAPYPGLVPVGGPIMLSRSHSVATLSSSDSSSQEMYHSGPAYMMVETPLRGGMNKSEPELTQIVEHPSGRMRLQSSPQTVGLPGMLSPSSGKADRFARPSPISLQRQNSYHGTSPSPRRSLPINRANSTQSGFRRSRPTSLAASALGITPIVADDPYSNSPLLSPSTSTSSIGTHSRQRSDASLAPFTSSMGGMTISPDMSDSGEPSLVPIPMTVPPMTPLSPSHGAPGHGTPAGVFPNLDYGDLQGQMSHHFAAMPNKHYVPQHYVQYPQAYVPNDFAPVMTAPRRGAPGWR